jgi:hypothetical protein
MPTIRISLARTLAIVALVAVVLSLIIVPARRRMEWTRLVRQTDARIRYLRPTEPNNINPYAWDCIHDRVVTAYCNICSSPGHPATVEMYRLRKDLEVKLGGEIGLDTLKWIWARLGETGPGGKRYIERFEPWFRECIP